MQNIQIHRCDGELAKKYQGYVCPDDGSWRVFIDKDGFPHFLIRTQNSEWEGEGEPPPETVFTLMANVDSFLAEDHESVRGLMENIWCGPNGEPDEFTDEDWNAIRPVDFGPRCDTL